MAETPKIYIVCSDRHRNGKTLLARVLVDYLLLKNRDPFVIDANFPEGALRAAFPGRTALVDLAQVQGQMKLFDTIMGSLGRDYVIDIPAPQFENFFEIFRQVDFKEEAMKAGFQIVVLFLVDNDLASLNAADDLQIAIAPATLVHVRNMFIGSVEVGHGNALTIDMPILDREVMNLIEDRRFSLRNFLLGEELSLPAHFTRKLQIFLLGVITGLRDIEPALTMAKLRA